MEEWKRIKDFEDYYLISNYGRVKSLYVNKLITPCDNGKGYLRVSLRKNGRQYTKYIHVLVAQAFIDNPNNLVEVNHLDENKHNNHMSNLEWCTHKYNCNYGTRNVRTVESKARAIGQYNKDGQLIKVWNGTTPIVKELGYKRSAIRNCIYGLSKSSNGYIWRYIVT
jgi:hypothetical protein